MQKYHWEEPQNTIEKNPNNSDIIHLTVFLEELDCYLHSWLLILCK